MRKTSYPVQRMSTKESRLFSFSLNPENLDAVISEIEIMDRIPYRTVVENLWNLGIKTNVLMYSKKMTTTIHDSRVAPVHYALSNLPYTPENDLAIEMLGHNGKKYCKRLEDKISERKQKKSYGSIELHFENTNYLFHLEQEDDLDQELAHIPGFYIDINHKDDQRKNIIGRNKIILWPSIPLQRRSTRFVFDSRR